MISIGTDIVQIERVQAVLQRQGERFVKRILTPQEIEEYRVSRLGHRLLAKRFAAKEALAKALGTGIGRDVSWQDIRIDHNAAGAPIVELSGGARRLVDARGGAAVQLSLADEMDYVVAFALIDSRQ